MFQLIQLMFQVHRFKTHTPPAPSTESSCHPSYSGCLNANARITTAAAAPEMAPTTQERYRFFGPDVFDLDRDNDGWECE